MKITEGKENQEPVQRVKEPLFNHPEIRQLYVDDMRIDHQVIKGILGLPRDTLINDLEKVLDDTVARYEFFQDKVERDGWIEEEMLFPVHSVFLLTELNATESLYKIFQILRKDEDFLDFWFDDFLTEEIWRVIYQLGNNQLEALKKFLFEPDIYVIVRYEIFCAVAQIAWHQNERRPEVVKWMEDVFTYLLEKKNKYSFEIDDFIGLAIGDVMNLKIKELLPLVEKLFDNGMVAVEMCGDLSRVKSDILDLETRHNNKRDILNIYDRYTDIISTWAGYMEEESKDNNAGNVSEGVTTETLPVEDAGTEKIGRNSPCPCGSGKKYKKCCMN